MSWKRSQTSVGSVDDFGPEDIGNEDFNPMEAALLPMMMHSNMEDEDDDEEEEYSDEDY